jgi:hypothetical protein
MREGCVGSRACAEMNARAVVWREVYVGEADRGGVGWLDILVGAFEMNGLGVVVEFVYIYICVCVSVCVRSITGLVVRVPTLYYMSIAQFLRTKFTRITTIKTLESSQQLPTSNAPCSAWTLSPSKSSRPTVV